MAAPERTATPPSPTRAPHTPTAPGTAPGRGVQQDFDPEALRRLLPPHKVIVHNNDFNTFDEVIKILIKAVPAITYEAAVGYAYEIHNSGAAVPFTGPEERAEAVAGVIRTIGIKVTVERDQ